MKTIPQNNYLDFQNSLEQGISQQILPTYVYSYPSKRTYRKFLTPFKINEIWNDNTGELNLYLHIPFCEYRCSYCTLFSISHFTPELVNKYIEKICSQIIYYGTVANNRTLTSIYFGGGTPTVLSVQQFEKIFATIYRAFPKISSLIEINIESTPDRINLEFLIHLKQLGVNRISIGVQTLQPEELKALGRQHSVAHSLAALDQVSHTFENFNVDLIYGLQGQTKSSWLQTMMQTLTYRPNILSLYPVVARPLTKIQKAQNTLTDLFMNDQEKYQIYDENITLLKQHGYQQDSFSRFSKISSASYLQETLDFQGVPLIGLGAGARSYKDQYHYSTDYALAGKNSLEIIKDFINPDFSDDYTITHGIILNQNEQKRRYMMLNLSLGKILVSDYMKKFKSNCLLDFAEELAILNQKSCITFDENHNITLTALGFKFSNLIALLFYSKEMRQLEKEYQPK